jgi:hypothetical protein
MFLRDVLERLIEFAAGLLGAHGVEAGLVATALVVLWHGHSILAMLQSALRTVRIGFVSAALVGVLLVFAVAMGWISVSSLPALPALPWLPI